MKNKNIYIFSGINGDGDLVDFLSNNLTQKHDVFNFTLFRGDNYNEFNFKSTFEIIKYNLEKILNNNTKNQDNIFILHSFSFLIFVYFFNEYKNYIDEYFSNLKIISLDKSESDQICEYFKKNPKENLFSEDVLFYMSEHKEVSILENIGINYSNIESSDIDTDHNFTDEKGRAILFKKIDSLLINKD